MTPRLPYRQSERDLFPCLAGGAPAGCAAAGKPTAAVGCVACGATVEPVVRAGKESERERLLHGICDALRFLPPPTENAGTAILRALLKGTDHEGHNDG